MNINMKSVIKSSALQFKHSYDHFCVECQNDSLLITWLSSRGNKNNYFLSKGRRSYDIFKWQPCDVTYTFYYQSLLFFSIHSTFEHCIFPSCTLTWRVATHFPPSKVSGWILNLQSSGLENWGTDLNSQQRIKFHHLVHTFLTSFLRYYPSEALELILSCPFVADAAMITTQTEDHS